MLWSVDFLQSLTIDHKPYHASVATASQLRQDEDVTIGRPIPNYSCYVVDTDLVPVGVGVEGELLIGGPGVASAIQNGIGAVAFEALRDRAC